MEEKKRAWVITMDKEAKNVFPSLLENNGFRTAVLEEIEHIRDYYSIWPAIVLFFNFSEDLTANIIQRMAMASEFVPCPGVKMPTIVIVTEEDIPLKDEYSKKYVPKITVIKTSEPNYLKEEVQKVLDRLNE